MHILLINHYAGSPDMGMEFRPYYLAREWVKMGHRVDIIAASYSHLRRKNPDVIQDFQTKVIDGINYHWIKTRTYEGNGVIRALTMAQFVSKLWIHVGKLINEIEPDVVICSSTYPLDTFVGQRIRKKSKKKVKLIHEVHDMWPATLIEVGGMSKKHPFVIAMQIGENSAYKHSDKVVSLLPYAEDYMKEHGLADGKFVCIPNGIVEEEWENPEDLPEKHKEVFDELKKQGKFIVGYFGGHALSNALDNLLMVANEIKGEKDVHFVLVGDGVEKKNLMRTSESLKLDNVTFLDPVTKKAVPTLCEEFDCIYMGGHASPLYRFGLCPNKLFDAMMAGKPVIFAFTTPKTYVEKYKCGIKLESLDIKGCKNAILKLKRMADKERKNMGENGRSACKKNHLYKVLAQNFIKEIDIWRNNERSNFK